MNTIHRIVLFSLSFLFAVTAYTQDTTLTVKVTEEINLPFIPSASALEQKGKYFYVAGDDSPFLFRLDTNLQITKHFLIHDKVTPGVDRIPKDEKPDWEAMVNYKWGNSKDLLVFGSGSGENRKRMTRVRFTGKGYEVKSYSLKHLYAKMMEQGDIAPEDFNIEGAASWKDHIIFMNRGTNQLILVPKFAFTRFMKWKGKKQERKKLRIDFYDFDLPEIDGVQARFSGGTKVSGEHVLVFCASVERTDSSVDDGEVLGSFVGLIPLKKLKKGEMQIARVTKKGEPYMGKIESVDVLKVGKNKLSLVGVTDDDLGGSTFLYMKMRR